MFTADGKSYLWFFVLFFSSLLDHTKIEKRLLLFTAGTNIFTLLNVLYSWRKTANVSFLISDDQWSKPLRSWCIKGTDESTHRFPWCTTIRSDLDRDFVAKTNVLLNLFSNWTGKGQLDDTEMVHATSPNCNTKFQLCFFISQNKWHNSYGKCI